MYRINKYVCCMRNTTKKLLMVTKKRNELRILSIMKLFKMKKVDSYS